MANPPGKAITDDFEDSRDYVQSLARGLSALRAFDSDHTHLSLAEIPQFSGRLATTDPALVTPQSAEKAFDLQVIRG